jgi:hypothetical protein
LKNNWQGKTTAAAALEKSTPCMVLQTSPTDCQLIDEGKEWEKRRKNAFTNIRCAKPEIGQE